MTLVVPFDEIFADEVGLLSKNSSWERVELGKVCKVVNGFPFKSTLFTKDEGFPVVRIRDLTTGGTETFFNGDVPPEAIINNGDLLIGMDGNFRCVEWQGGTAGLNQRVCKIIADQRFLLRKFLLFGLNGYLKAIQDATSSVTVGHLSSRDILLIPFPLPPLTEQRRIVGKLELLLGKVSSSQQRLSRVPGLLKRFRQSVLAAACSGKLTADWREQNEDVDVAQMILNQIDAEKSDQLREKAKTKSKPTKKAEAVDRRIPYPEEDFFELPEAWLWTEFGRITNNHDGQRVPIKESDRANRHGPYPYYGAFGIIDEFDDYRFDGTYLLLAEDGKNLESRTRPIALRATGKFWVNNHAHVLTAKAGIALGYLDAWLNSSSLNLTPFLTGIDQVKLNREAMDQIPVPLPPLAEQQEIVRRVEKLFAFADQIEARLRQAQAHVDRLTQSLLAKAFRGELVPTEHALATREARPYEPASALLERIRKQSKEISLDAPKQRRRKRKT